MLNIPTEGNEEEEKQLQGTIAANTNDEITTLEVEAVIKRSRNCKSRRMVFRRRYVNTRGDRESGRNR